MESSRRPLIVLGVDPGYAACGVAVLRREGQRWRAIEFATIRTPSTDPVGMRMEAVWRGVGRLFKHAPTVTAMEAQERAQRGHEERGTTSAKARRTLVVCGLVRALALQHGVTLVEVEPDDWRRALGLRRTASKEQAQRVIRALVRGCPARMSSHASDAGGVAICGARMIGARGG